MRNIAAHALALLFVPTLVLAEPQPTEVQRTLLSPTAATWISLGATIPSMALGAGLLAGGAVAGSTPLAIAGAFVLGLGVPFGPAIGFWYGGAGYRGTWMALIRLLLSLAGAGAGAAVAGAVVANDGSTSNAIAAGAGVSAIFVVPAAILAVYDLVRVGPIVEATNKAEMSSDIRFSPVIAVAGRETYCGLAAGIPF